MLIHDNYYIGRYKSIFSDLLNEGIFMRYDNENAFFEKIGFTRPVTTSLIPMIQDVESEMIHES